MKKIIFFLLLCLAFSCAEEVIEKPENLIPEDKMKQIIYDLALFNSIKSTNPAALTKNNLAISTDFVFNKHDIDSVQFVQSDLYYASIPLKYQAIYEAVELRLEKEKGKYDDAREKRTDSIRNVNEKRRDSLKNANKTNYPADKQNNKK
ncbi:DUF4296 domain-containing protein [Croceivirga thetidis]|uniref:DUF4296 domain-containing protein n=1 Tax=Croceivirga thetidis TaxID=2721623 RepID=A0ABX1GS49_9FLAO|nr:DUF4296 domain-containing protein [Croceivirga thetidis]NKI31587.1 DUF4296 domain-containing protein [Croceivirga thetidis]